MQRVKTIFVATFSLFVVTVTGAMCALCLDTVYFNSLILPPYVLPPFTFSLFAGVIYILFTFILTNGIMHSRKHTELFYVISTLLFLNIMYMLVFFRLRYEMTSIFILSIQIILLYILLKHCTLNLSSVLPVVLLIIIYTYFFVVNYGIILLNG